MVLFSIWVLAPFVGSLLLNALMAKRGSAIARTAVARCNAYSSGRFSGSVRRHSVETPVLAAGFQVRSSSRCLVRLDHHCCRHSSVCTQDLIPWVEEQLELSGSSYTANLSSADSDSASQAATNRDHCTLNNLIL
jgi:hypothetical protein